MQRNHSYLHISHFQIPEPCFAGRNAVAPPSELPEQQRRRRHHIPFNTNSPHCCGPTDSAGPCPRRISGGSPGDLQVSPWAHRWISRYLRGHTGGTPAISGGTTGDQRGGNRESRWIHVGTLSGSGGGTGAEPGRNVSSSALFGRPL